MIITTKTIGSPPAFLFSILLRKRTKERKQKLIKQNDINWCCQIVNRNEFTETKEFDVQIMAKVLYFLVFFLIS